MDEFLLSILKWGLLSISTLVIFSPFVYLGVRKWHQNKPVYLWHAVTVYLASFLLFIGTVWVVASCGKLANTWEVLDVFDSVNSYLFFVCAFLWPLQTFYLAKLVRNTLTFLNAFVALLIACGIFAGLVLVFAYALAYAFGSILSNHF